MTIETKPLAEITQEAVGILCKQMGVANTLRFINQYAAGHGNYTEERRTLYQDRTVDDLVAEIEKDRLCTQTEGSY